MRPPLRAPRLLPTTILAMAALLAVKSVALVRAAVPPPAAAAAVAKAAAPSAPPAAPSAASAPPIPSAAPAATPAPTLAAAPPPDPPVSAAERGLLLDLRHRSAQLDAREAAVKSREAMLAAAEKRLAVRLDELTALQTRLEALDKVRKQRVNANWTGLVKLYENMKPRDAATIFDGLDMAVLLQVMDRMNERKAAPVLAAMQPERARLVTAQLAALRARRDAPPGPPPNSPPPPSPPPAATKPAGAKVGG
ncbi:MAG: hypothetical protein KGL55_05380 [Rhodospirillales bacterium]|nr:hypothetical protein [Rhodospirillales bacterium]